VSLDGRPLGRRAWDFDPRRSVLEALVRLKRGRLTVDGTC
jgi:hypothetical protein